MPAIKNPSNIIIKKHYLYLRSFPWRKKISPYRIMIAEFMLHRTRAEQVAPVFEKFVIKYPNIVALSKAKEKEIKKVTITLGLHWRYRHFIDSVKFINECFNGKIPYKRKSLLEIPGIGDYIAGAILTVCFNKKEYVVDSNIARFINRFYNLDLTGEIRRKKIIVEKAKILFSIDNPKKLLFPVLDFIAFYCKPRKPLCAKCILAKKCSYSEDPLRRKSTTVISLD